jgi:hypothetical protein
MMQAMTRGNESSAATGNCWWRSRSSGGVDIAPGNGAGDGRESEPPEARFRTVVTGDGAIGRMSG